MSLNRRIVLDDSEINSPPALELETQPAPEPEPKVKRANLIETPLPGGGYIVQPMMQTPSSAAMLITALPIKSPSPNPIVQPDGSLNESALQKAIRQDPRLAQFDTFNEFFELAQTGLKENLNCKGCGSQLGFETEFSNRTLTCKSCGRVTSIELFQMEHAG